MKARSAKPTAVLSKKQRNNKRPAAAAPNATINLQNRRVLAQHYRAKYGVK